MCGGFWCKKWIPRIRMLWREYRKGNKITSLRRRFFWIGINFEIIIIYNFCFGFLFFILSNDPKQPNDGIFNEAWNVCSTLMVLFRYFFSTHPINLIPFIFWLFFEQKYIKKIKSKYIDLFIMRQVSLQKYVFIIIL